jgi:hypothetical protein
MAVGRQVAPHQAKEKHPDGGEVRRDRRALEAPEPREKTRETQQEQAARKEPEAQPRRGARLQKHFFDIFDFLAHRVLAELCKVFYYA